MFLIFLFLKFDANFGLYTNLRVQYICCNSIALLLRDLGTSLNDPETPNANLMSISPLDLADGIYTRTCTVFLMYAELRRNELVRIF